MKTINWAILGCGNIANCYATALTKTPGATLYAAASRTLPKAQEFSQKYGFKKAYGSYEECLADPEVDAVYIATPHPMHKDLAIAALNAKKAVLCEKPTCLHKPELEEVLAAAKANDCFFMEAMWTRFQPAFTTAMKYIADGKIGELLNLYADICCKNDYYPGSRYYEVELGGGAAWDLGIYMLTAALSGMSAASGTAFGDIEPEKFYTILRKAFTGVDAFETVIMSYKNMIATLTAGVDTGSGEVTRAAKYIGTKGSIVLDGFWYGQSVKLYDTDGNLISEDKLPFAVNGYEYEAAHVTELIGKGEKSSPIHTWNDSLRLAALMDRILEDL